MLGSAQTPTPEADTSPIGLSLSDVEIQGLVDPGIKAAMEDLRERVGKDLTSAYIVRAERVTWNDTSLGCPESGLSYAQVLTPSIWMVMSYQGKVFDYRISGERAVLCLRKSTKEPLDRTPLGGIWSRLAQVPTGRSEVAAAELNGRIYVFGGFGAGAVTNEEYDPATNSWRSLAPIPRGVDHAAAVALDGKIYLIGGFDGRFGPVDAVWAYDPESGGWERKADLPTPRGGLGAAVVKGKIYAIGGRGIDGDVGATEEYDPLTDTWASRSTMLTPRDHIAVSVVRGKVYVIGGRLDTFTRNLESNEVYDPVADSWSKMAPLPTPRSGIASAVVEGKVYVFGGESGQGTFSENERYDPVTDSWQPMEPMPTARHGLGAVALGNRIYVVAGGPRVGGSQSSLNEVFIALESLPIEPGLDRPAHGSE